MASKTEGVDAKLSTIPEGGQYFVDQVTGQYYYQSQDGETMTVVQSADVDQPLGAAEEGVEDTNQVVLNTGGDQYQTVTIVPSDTGAATGSGG